MATATVWKELDGMHGIKMGFLKKGLCWKPQASVSKAKPLERSLDDL